MDIIPLLLALGGTGFWILVKRAERASKRRKLGGDVREIRLYRRWVRVLQLAFLAVGVVLPVAAVFLWIKRDGYAEDLVREFVYSIWSLSNAFALSLGGQLMIGERGFIYGPADIVEWSSVESIAWDRDIGQHQWGLTIAIRSRTGVTKQRIFVHRDLKPEVDDLLQRNSDKLPTPPAATPATATPATATASA